MRLYIYNYERDKDNYFVSVYLPKIIRLRLISSCKEKNTSLMNSYLKKVFNISLIDVINKACSNIITMWSGTTCILSIDTNVYEMTSNEKLNSLIKLIDQGNLDVKGLNIFKEALEFIQHNMNSIYKIYTLEVERSKK